MKEIKDLIKDFAPVAKSVRKIDDGNEPTQMSLFEPKEIVRPEYNIGKWAGIIFVSPHSKNVNSIREFHFTKEINGTEAPASIVIAPRQGEKTPTTTTLRLFLAICELWQMQGRPENGKVSFSARQIASLAGWGWSGVIAKRIEEHIRILVGTTIDWRISFTADNDPHHSLSSMKLLNNASYLVRGDANLKGSAFTQNHWVELNSIVVEGMLSNRVRPINFRALSSIRNENCSNLYLLIELALSNYNFYHATARKIIYDDLGLDGSRYEIKAVRKQKLQELAKEIDGKALVSGTISITITETADKTDWKLEARRVAPEITARGNDVWVMSQDQAQVFLDDVVDTLQRLPRPGNIGRYQGYYKYLILRLGEKPIFQALSETKADYIPDDKKGSAAQYFIWRVKEICKARGVKFPTAAERKGSEDRTAAYKNGAQNP